MIWYLQWVVHATHAAVESIPRNNVQQILLKLNASVVTSTDIYPRIARRDHEDRMAKVQAKGQRVWTKVTTGTKARERKVRASLKVSPKARKAMARRVSSMKWLAKKVRNGGMRMIGGMMSQERCLSFGSLVKRRSGGLRIGQENGARKEDQENRKEHSLKGLWWLLGVAGPAAGEILELQRPRMKVWGSICKAHGLWLGLPATKFSYQSARFVVLTGPATDEILELHSVRLMVFAGLAWACPPTQFWTSSLRFFRSMLGLPLSWTECLARFWALVCSMSKIRWLCWPRRLALVGLFVLCHLAVPSFSGSEMIWLDPLVGLSWCCCSLWNEWDLHVYFSVEMNVVPTSGGQVVL